MFGQPWHYTRPHALLPPSVLDMDDLTIEGSIDSQLRVSPMCLAYFFDMLPMGVCTTGHRQTSGRLVQESVEGNCATFGDHCKIALGQCTTVLGRSLTTPQQSKTIAQQSHNNM